MFYPLARPLVRGLRNESHRAFTLIELLAVIGIIGILSAITFGIVKGVNERAAIGQAKAELASLAQSLEEYKRQYGDYPQTGAFTQAAASTSSAIAANNAQAYLFSALTGSIGPTNQPLNSGGKVFVDFGKFTLENTNQPSTSGAVVANCFLDPWGRRYLYYYKNATSPATWTAPTYVLYSCGPTIGATASATTEPPSAKPKSTGIVDYSDSSNLDNLYSNQN